MIQKLQQSQSFQEDLWLLRRQLYYRLAEERVGPCEPNPGYRFWVVDGEGFVDQVVARLGDQAGQAGADFLVAGGGQDLGNEGEWPDVARSCVGAADAFVAGGLVEVGVVFGEDELACIAVDGVVKHNEPQVGKRDEGRKVGVVEDHGLAVAADLVGEDLLAVLLSHSVLVDGGLDALAGVLHASAQNGRLSLEDRGRRHFVEHVGRHELEVGRHHRVAWDVVGVVVGVVRRPEAGLDHPRLEGGLDLPAGQFAWLAVEGVKLALVVLLVAQVLGLLVDHAHDPPQGLHEAQVHEVERGVLELVLVGEAQEGGQRVDLELALPDGLCRVFLQPAEVHRHSEYQGRRLVVEVKVALHTRVLKLLEGVRVRVSHDQLSLSVEKSFCQ